MGSRDRVLTPEAVIETALELVDTQGVEGLSMRALADRLEVKAASLYWHFRDKEQLLDLMALAVLDGVDVPIAPSWRVQARRACDELKARLQRRRAAAAVVLGCPSAVQRSRLSRDLARTLATAGVSDPEAAAFALVVQVVAESRTPVESPRRDGGTVRVLHVDSGSWRVRVRAGGLDAVEPATSVGGGGAAALDIRPDGSVVVNNRRGGNPGHVELNPHHTWTLKVHGGTWNTVLDLGGLRLAGVELDSGSGNVACTLPTPLGSVPVRVNSGIIGMSLHRPPGAPVLATVGSGCVRVRLDGHTIRAAAGDVRWATPGADASPDRYDLTVCSGCVKVTLDTAALPAPPPPAPPTATNAAPAGDGVELLLDGIEQRLRSAPR